MHGVGDKAVCALEVRPGVLTSAPLAEKVIIGTGTGAQQIYQRIIPSSSSRGRFAVPQSTWHVVYSGTVVGCGRAKLTAYYAWGSDAVQWVSYNRQVRLLHNGVQVAYETRNQTTQGWGVTLEYTGNFHDGDTFSVDGYSAGPNTSARNLDESNYSLARL